MNMVPNAGMQNVGMQGMPNPNMQIQNPGMQNPNLQNQSMGMMGIRQQNPNQGASFDDSNFDMNY